MVWLIYTNVVHYLVFAISGAALGTIVTKYSAPKNTIPVGSIIRDNLDGEKLNMLFQNASLVLRIYAVHTLVDF